MAVIEYTIHWYLFVYWNRKSLNTGAYIGNGWVSLEIVNLSLKFILSYQMLYCFVLYVYIYIFLSIQ